MKLKLERTKWLHGADSSGSIKLLTFLSSPLTQEIDSYLFHLICRYHLSNWIAIIVVCRHIETSFSPLPNWFYIFPCVQEIKKRKKSTFNEASMSRTCAKISCIGCVWVVIKLYFALSITAHYLYWALAKHLQLTCVQFTSFCWEWCVVWQHRMLSIKLRYYGSLSHESIIVRSKSAATINIRKDVNKFVSFNKNLWSHLFFRISI